MEFLCKVCDRSIIENESECKEYLATSRQKNDKSLYKKQTIININFDEFDKIINDFITIHNIRLFYSINREFVKDFDNNFTAKKETNCCYNIDDITNIKKFYDIC